MKKEFDTRTLGHVKIAVIGPATDKQLLLYGLKADCVPPAYKAEDLAEAMKPLVRRGDKILLPRRESGKKRTA